ncbi:hypothetical protein B0H63DRAFT_524597 [Podospora didyma]|uniref:Uncharacterized protein n=1 Tax=Podospora didyma TaxID=330526 RepID=A0AAE0NI13_9PEZI|nr:hypothetical protein B0H63DRAFT_524597 [Podospora didyma]
MATNGNRPVDENAKALDDATEYSTQLASLIKDNTHKTKGVDVLSNDKRLEAWAKDADNLATQRTKFELYVAAQGATGASKTSLLNAVLGYKALLPSSSAEAATATICKVAYNHSDDPAKLFRADIFFRTRDDMKKELDDFFDDIKQRNELLGSFDAPIVEEFNANIEDVARKVNAVWGYAMEQVEVMSISELLTKDDPTAKLLSTTKSICGKDPEEFAREVKKYLDSTYAKVTGKAGAITRRMALWPLIDHRTAWSSEICEGRLLTPPSGHGTENRLSEFTATCSSAIKLSEEDLKSKILDPTCDKLLQELHKFGNQLTRKVAACDALKVMEKPLLECAKFSDETAERWILRNPRVRTSIRRLHYLTFGAIIQRGGDTFTSRSEGVSTTYTWMQDILAKTYFQGQEDYLQSRQVTLHEIKEEAKDLVAKALRDISAQSSGIHEDLTEHISSKWRKLFRKAFEIRGSGYMKRRHDSLLEFSQKHGKGIYKDAVADMEARLKENFQELHSTLDKAWKHGLQRFRAQMSLIAGGVIQDEHGKRTKNNSVPCRTGPTCRWAYGICS